jgi:hypothetical protein
MEIMSMIFNIKKAAIFGIDARIGLIILAIASMAIALNKQSLIESSRIKDINVNIVSLENAILTDYAKNYKNSDFITTGYASMTDSQKHSMLQGKTHLYKDPWGNDWNILAFVSSDTNLKAYGKKIQPVCIVIFSAGADGYANKYANYTGANYDDCINNVSLNYTSADTQTDDDYFYKFTTIDYEITINEDTQTRLNDIKQALYNYQEAKRNIRLKYCTDLSQSTADADVLCDINTDGTYESSELDLVNYMPKSSTDLTAAVYFNSTVYDNTTLAGIKSFLIEIGLQESYANDLALRQLDYNSNSTGSTTGSYVASFYYKAL